MQKVHEVEGTTSGIQLRANLPLLPSQRWPRKIKIRIKSPRNAGKLKFTGCVHAESLPHAMARTAQGKLLLRS